MKSLILSGLLFISGLAQAATSYGYLSTKGSRQGAFRGDVVSKGHERTAEVLGLSFEIVTPRTENGQASGKRQLRPLTITKAWGGDSVQYYTALSTNEILSEVKIEFFSRLKPDMPEALTKTIILTNANVASMSDSMTPKLIELNDTETITFTYQKIKIINAKGEVFEDEVNQQ